MWAGKKRRREEEKKRRREEEKKESLGERNAAESMTSKRRS